MIIGPTGEFPGGMMTPDDEFEINIAIGRAGNNVIMEFGRSIRWIGFSPDIAEKLANTLLAHAAKVRANFTMPKNWDS